MFFRDASFSLSTNERGNVSDGGSVTSASSDIVTFVLSLARRDVKSPSIMGLLAGGGKKAITEMALTSN
jgi:hypothetical protein